MLDDIALAGMEARHLPGQPDSRPFTALLHDDDPQRDAALSRLLSELAGPDVRVVRMGNSMRSRLMLEHILIRVAGTEGRISQEEAARRIARTIAERQGRETRVIMLITQAETLHSKTLRLLQAMQPFFAENGAPTLQVVFVGRQAFRALLDGRGMTPLREALGFQPQAEDMRSVTPDSVPMPESDADAPPLPTAQDLDQPATPAQPMVEAGTLHRKMDHSGAVSTLPRRSITAEHAAGSVPAARRRRSVALGFAVFAAMAGAAYLGLRTAFYREVPARAVLSIPHPTGSPLLATPPAPVPGGPAIKDPQASTPAPGSAAPAEAAPSDPGRSRNTLPAARRDPEVPEPSSPPPRENAPSPAPGTPTPRVVIHVPAGSEGAEAMSAQLRASLGPRLGAVAARRVAGTPDRPSIRFFHPGDEPVAQQVAAWMADAGLIWTLQDFSSFSPRPSRGTIEVWLPRS